MEETKTSNLTDGFEGDIKAMFQKVQEQQRDLKKRTDQICDMITQITGKTPQELEGLTSNSQNFSKSDWEKIQKIKRENESKMEALYKNMGLDYKAEQNKHNSKVAQKKRRRMGGRRKNWIAVE